VPDEEARLTGVVVPDDISALSRDIAAYRREVRRAERARRIRRLLARRGAVPALVVTAAIVLAGVVAALLSVMAPRTVGRPPSATQLATSSKQPGTVGGLMPSAILRTPDGSPVGSRSAVLRPEVFALVPVDCGCGELLNALSGQAGSEQLRLAVVIPAATDDSATKLTAALERGRGRPSIYFDPTATLATGVATSGVTVVVVDRDGTIFDIEQDVVDPATTSLDAELQSMLLPHRR
jgi:hypothetical protein